MKIPYLTLQKLTTLAAVALTGNAFADTTYTSGVTAEWSTVENWNNGLPQGTEVLRANVTTAGNAVITSATVTLSGTAKTNDLTLNSSKLEVSGTLTTTGLNESSPLGKVSLATNSTLNVNAGAVMSIGAGLSVNTSTMNIASGASVTWSNIASNQFVTVASGSLNVSGTLAPTTSGWKGNQIITVGNSAATAALNISGGSVTGDSLEVSPRGGGTVNITGGGSLTILNRNSAGIKLGEINNVNNNAQINVTSGTLNNGGVLKVGVGTKNASYLSNTGTSTITVNGGTMIQTGTSYIGQGRVGIINVSSGSFTAAQDMIVGGLDKNFTAPTGNAKASGAINVSGGSLTTTALRIGDSTVADGINAGYAISGSLSVTGGTVKTNLLSATNGANSAVSFSGGTISTKSTAIANGNAFSVGNGTTAATLVLDGGSHSFADGISLSNHATLQGTGAITAGALSVLAGSTLNPGNSPGALTLASTTLNGGANYNWQVYDAAGVAGTGYDTISLNSGANLVLANTAENTFNINLWSLSSINTDVNGNALNFDNTVNHTWTLIATDQAISNFSADKFAVYLNANNGTAGFTNALAGGAFSVALADNNTDLVLNFTAVPEPSTWAMLIGGAGLLTFGQRLRRRNA